MHLIFREKKSGEQEKVTKEKNVCVSLSYTDMEVERGLDAGRPGIAGNSGDNKKEH